MNAGVRLRVAAAVAMAPLTIALCVGPSASASPSAAPATASEQDGCVNTDSSPQSCIKISYVGNHLRTITVGVGAHVRGGPYSGEYDIWDSAKLFSLHTGRITFPQNKSYFIGRTMWGLTYTNNGAGWAARKGDRICGQFTQDNLNMSRPACVTMG